MAPSNVHFPLGRVLCLFGLLLILVDTAQPQNGGSIQGVAVDGQNAVVPQAKITVFCDCHSPECNNLSCDSCCPAGFSATAVTGQDGSFRVTDIPFGTYSVRGEAASFSATTVTGIGVTIASASSVEIRFGSGSKATQIQVSTMETIAGQVVNEVDNKPLANVTVRAARRKCDCKTECPQDPCDTCCPYEEASKLTTDNNGNFTTDLPPGDYNFRVEVGPFTKDKQIKVHLGTINRFKIGLDLIK